MKDDNKTLRIASTFVSIVLLLVVILVFIPLILSYADAATPTTHATATGSLIMSAIFAPIVLLGLLLSTFAISAGKKETNPKNTAFIGKIGLGVSIVALIFLVLLGASMG